MHSADDAVARYLSVRLFVRPSVTRRYSIETAKRIVKKISPSTSHNSSFSVPNGMLIIRRRPPNGGVECKGYEKNHDFDQYLALSPK